MSEPALFTVPDKLVGKTVLAVLRVALPGESWSKLRQRLQRSQVSVNGIACIDEARRVILGDTVRMHQRPLPAVQPSQVKVVFIDPHIVVVEKPAGMMTQRRPEERNWPAEMKSKQPSLDEAVFDLISQRAHRGRHPRSSTRAPGLRLVHRLDRDTSGLLVMARSQEAERDLIHQFRRHTAHRVYWAIVHGHPIEGTIETHLVRDRGDGRRGSVSNSKIGQRAVTHVRPLERLGDYSLIECQLETGRTNQIRIHLSERGHLVCGDLKYRQPYADKMIDDRSQAPRLALHAAELGFRHPMTDENLEFQMPFPDDLSEFYQRLLPSSPRPHPDSHGKQ